MKGCGDFVDLRCPHTIWREGQVRAADHLGDAVCA